MFRLLLISCILHMHIASKAATLPEEFVARKGLPGFLWKLQHSRDTVTVAYLGGSITEAKNGWREQTFNWLQKQYPRVAFKQIDAAIGGTTSRLGVFRLNEQVLKYKPDLLFVEFAVNDDDDTRENVLTSMEGIVRKTWMANAKTDICFVYTFAHYLLKNYNIEGAPSTVKAMEEIAGHYGIPSVNLSPKIVRLINDKKLFVSGKQPFINDSTFFSGDGVHPYKETGHVYYTESIINAIMSLHSIAGPVKHMLGTAYFSSKFEKSDMIPVTPAMAKGNIGHITVSENKNENLKRYSRYLSDVYKLSDTAAILSFSFSGESIGFLDIIGPSTGQLKVLIDNDAPRYINRFDKYCFYTRLSFTFIEGLSNKKHKIRVQISPATFNKFGITEKQLPMEADMKDKYSEYSWMVAKVLVNGKVYNE